MWLTKDGGDTGLKLPRTKGYHAHMGNRGRNHLTREF